MAAGGSILRHQFTATGGLLVEVAEVSSVNRLMQVNTLGGIPVQVTIPNTYLQNFGMIKGVPLWYTDAQLVEFLQPEGVIAARRHYRRRGKPGQAAKPTDRVVLTFRSNTERPSKVNLGFTRHEVEEYIEAPPRCFNCQALGHIARHCKGSTKCKKCGASHLTKNCKGEAPLKCANCGGEHPADYVNCKVRLAALKKTKTFVRGPRQSPPPTEDPPSLESFPPLVQETSHPTQAQKQVERQKNANKTKRALANAKKTTQNVPPSKPPQATQMPSAPVAPPSTPGKRTYSSAVTRTASAQESSLPALGSMTISDVICLFFSVLRNLVSQLPSCTFKNIIEGVMVFEPAIVTMMRGSCQFNG